MTINASDLRSGMFIEREGEILEVINVFKKVIPSFITAKTFVLWATLKNIETQEIKKLTFGWSEPINLPILEKVAYQITYQDDEGWRAMNMETNEELIITKNMKGYEMLFEGLEINCLFYDGRFFRIELPRIITVEIIDITDIGSEEFKSAKLKNGIETNVPLYINIGDRIRLETENKKFIQKKLNNN